MGPPPNRPPAAQPAPAAPCSSASRPCMQRHGVWTGIGHALAEHEPSSNGSAEIDAALQACGAAAAQSEHERGDSGGLLRLLLRARDCAATGFKNTARHYAVEALEFHHTARRDAAAKSASGEMPLRQQRTHAQNSVVDCAWCCCNTALTITGLSIPMRCACSQRGRVELFR